MTLLEIAERYGIIVEYLSEIPQKNTLAPGMAFGCDPARNILFIREDYKGKENLSIAEGLHEVMHILLTPPGTDIGYIHEAWVLLQFERAFSSQYLSPEDHEQVLDYQDMTSLDLWEEGSVCFDILADVPNPEEKDWWQEGLARARRVGLLDEQNKVTWQRPTWPENLNDIDLEEWML